MALYILLTRLHPDVVKTREQYIIRNDEVARRVERMCPDVTWKANYATLGPYDYLDVFEAPDNEAAQRVALIVRSVGQATTEIWGASTWDQFKAMLGHASWQEQDGGPEASNDRVAASSDDSFPASDPPAWTGTAAS